MLWLLSVFLCVLTTDFADFAVVPINRNKKRIWIEEFTSNKGFKQQNKGFHQQKKCDLSKTSGGTMRIFLEMQWE
jgi:hypothetical protein